MRIAFFSDAFASQHGFGLGRYTWELFDALLKLEHPIDVIPVSAWTDMNFQTQQKLHAQYNYHILPWGRRKMALAWSTIGLPRLERWLNQPIDLVHRVDSAYPTATRKPWIMTIHDLGPLTHPGFFSGGRPYLMSRALHQGARHARTMICDSQNTANELQTYLGNDLEGKIRVVGAGVSSMFFEKPDPECLETLDPVAYDGTPFILYAGSINPRKNLVRVIAALEAVASQVPHHFVLAGATGWDSQETMVRIKTSPVADRVHLLGYVTNQQLIALYHRATAFVFPSLFEGFGLPVLEAMACECPVITSNVSSLPEVAGDAALLVDPTDISAIADAIVRIIQNQSLAAQLRSWGQARAGSFTWDEIARQVYSVYSDALAMGEA